MDCFLKGPGCAYCLHVNNHPHAEMCTHLSVISNSSIFTEKPGLVIFLSRIDSPQLERCTQLPDNLE